MSKRYFFLIPFFLIFFFHTNVNAAKKTFPAPAGYVNDFANVVDVESKARISALIDTIGKKSSIEITIVTIPAMEEYGLAGIEEAAVKLFEEWGVGKKGKDNGILILASIKDKKIRIEIGYGLESQITDGAAGEIIRQDIAPFFKQGRYGHGFYNGLAAIAEKLNVGNIGEKQRPASSKGLKDVILIILFFLILLPFIILSRAGGLQSSNRKGIRRGAYGNNGFWSTGSGGFGGGGSGGGFGGFGGGGSGGGGASGNW